MAQIPFTSVSSTPQAGPSTTRHRHDVSPPNGPSTSGRTRSMSSGKERKRLKQLEQSWWKRYTNADDIQGAFKAFGEHCARNQIRVLLIDCLVMTNLFYPALSIYLQEKFPPLHPPAPPSHNAHRGGVAKEHPLSLLSTPWLDTFFPFPPPLLPRLSWDGWWGGTSRSRDQGGWVVDDAATSVSEEEIRLMKVGWADVGGILDRTEGPAWTERDDVLLNLIRSTAEEWESSYEAEGCVRELYSGKDGITTLSGPCVVLSPDSKLDGILPLQKLSLRGAIDDELSPNPVNWPSEGGKVYRSAGILMRTGESSDFEKRWTEAMTRIALKLDGEMFIESPRPVTKLQGPRESWALSLQLANSSTLSAHDEDDAPPPRQTSTIRRFIIFLYIAFFLIIGSQISNATQAHSRYGLAVTGIVQVCCSAIMSYSVLSLFGWQIGTSGEGPSLPIWLMPFVVLVVGVENMATLTKAVFSVPFSHSVPVRIGLGLSKVGPGIIWASLTDLGILGLVSLCINAQPVREFCRFAGLVIITDWFMLHTFFLTVLSIDAQRLELADVLANPDGASPRARLRSAGRERRSFFRRWTRARRNKSGSLLIILLSIGAIYYLTEGRRPGSSIANLYGYTPSSTSNLPPAVPFLTTANQLFHLSPSEKLWRALNPLHLPSIRISVPRASIVVLPRQGHHMKPADIQKMTINTSRILLPRLKPLFYLFKVVILPQLVTASSLYGLLLFLLKDSDLLDAQRTKLGRVDEPRSSMDEERQEKVTPTQMSITMLPCSHQADIEHVTTSDDGQFAVSVGTDDSVCLWRFAPAPGKGTREVLRADSLRDDAVVAVLVQHGWVVACTVGGTLQAWRFTDDGHTTASPPLTVQTNGSRIQAIAWDSARKSDDPFADPTLVQHPRVLVALVNGAILLIDIGTLDHQTIIPASDGPTRSIFCHPSLTHLVVLSISRDTTSLHNRSGDTWISHQLQFPSVKLDKVTCAAACDRGVVLAFRSGLIATYDLDGNPTHRLNVTSSSPIINIDVVANLSAKCTTCATITKSLFVIASTSSELYVYQIAEPGQTLCRCSRMDGLSTDPRFLIPPTAATPKPSPKATPSLLPPTSNGSIPLSSHGTRRLSSSLREERSNGDVSHGDQEQQILGTISIPFGGKCWRLVGDKLVGLRRVSSGIDQQSWQVWCLNLAEPRNGRDLSVQYFRFDDLVQSLEDSTETSMQAQRDERQLALSGRIPFPSSATECDPLAFVDIRPCEGTEGGLVFGMGNRIGMLHLDQTRATRSRFSTTGTGLGLSPPPRRDGETKKTS